MVSSVHLGAVLEIAVPKFLVGKTLAEARLPSRSGVVVIALRDAATGRFIYNPKADTTVNVDDFLIVISNSKQLAKLHALTGS